MITIQPERREDYAAIHEINVLALGQANEARLVKHLRKSSIFISGLSLVALTENRVGGHILFTPIAIQTKGGSVPGLALAPMAVHPEIQNQGIGSKLVREGVELCKKYRHGIVIVVGRPQFYSRFGFTLARAKGLEVPSPVPDEVFMVLELVPGALNGSIGMDYLSSRILRCLGRSESRDF